MIKRTKKITFEFDGEKIQGHEGESIAVALLRAGITTLRNAPRSNTPRGMFCVMGICQECLIISNGKKSEACRTKIFDGMIIEQVSNV